MRESDSDQTSDLLDRVDYANDNCDSKGMVTTGEEAPFIFCGKLGEVQRVCEEGVKAVSMNVIGEI